MTATSQPAFELKTIEGEKMVRACLRAGRRFSCAATDEHGVTQKETWDTTFEESPHVMMAAIETQAFLMIDWSQSRYVWIESAIKPNEWLVTQKQCVGRIVTGAAAKILLDQSRRK